MKGPMAQLRGVALIIAGLAWLLVPGTGHAQEFDVTVVDDTNPSDGWAAVEPPVEPQRKNAVFARAIGGGVVVLGIVVALVVLFGGRESTHLIVNSTPSGALVWLGDESLGTTPFDGAVELSEVSSLSMDFCQAILIEKSQHGDWKQLAGQWKRHF